VAQWGNNIFLRGVKNGERFNKAIRYKPTLYVPSQKPSKFKTLEGTSVSPIKFETIKEAKEFVSQYENQPELVYGLNQFVYTYIADNYQEIRFDRSLMQVYTIDIEVQCENGFPNQEIAAEELLSITVKRYGFDDIIVWGIGEYKTNNEFVQYNQCQNEVELLNRFINWWESIHPDAITGWNTEFFDIPYICNRIKRVLGSEAMKRLSPWRIINEKKINGKFGKANTVYEILGVSNLDYQQLYQKFTYTNQESYRLDHIAFVELVSERMRIHLRRLKTGIQKIIKVSLITIFKMFFW
jgi:DNA polymerase elongation subunit (family B)